MTLDTKPDPRLFWLQSLTASRVLLATGVPMVLLSGHDHLSSTVTALLLVLLIEGTDILDGQVARRLDLTTEFGAMFDPYADAAARFIVLWALDQAGRCVSLLIPVLVIRDLTAAYVRIWLAQNNCAVGARRSGKVKAIVLGTVSVLLAAGPLYWGSWKAVVVLVTSGVSIAVLLYSMLDYVLAARNSTRVRA